MSLGFVGLGVMGARMAGHLLRVRGSGVCVWNRTRDSSTRGGLSLKELREKGAVVAESLEELAATCSEIVICVSRTEDVEAVVAAMTPFAKEGTLFVDHSTIEPSAAVRLGERLRLLGHSLVDAPVTGGEKGAIEGTLTIFCGGEQADFERALPFMEAYGKTVRLVGGQGSGQMMKMANQIAVALTVLSMSECLVFAQKAGLDLEAAIELIGSGAGASWSLANYGPKAAARDWSPGFAVELQQKDLMYALRSARELGVSLPGTALTHQLFAALENAGRGGEASPALFEVIEGLSGG